MSTAIEPRRPFFVTLLGVLGIVQAIFAIPVGIALLADHGDRDLQRHAGVSGDALLGLGVGALAAGVITLLVAIGLLRGAEWARILLGVIQILHLGGGIYVAFAYRGTERWDGITSIIIASLILVILFSKRSQEFFASR